MALQLTLMLGSFIEIFIIEIFIDDTKLKGGCLYEESNVNFVVCNCVAGSNI